MLIGVWILGCDIFKPVKVRAPTGFRIRVAYVGGVEGDVDLSHLAGQGVFKLWDQPGAFERVEIGNDGAIRWSDEVELCPDAIYLQITRQSPKNVFPELSNTG